MKKALRIAILMLFATLMLLGSASAASYYMKVGDTITLNANVGNLGIVSAAWRNYDVYEDSIQLIGDPRSSTIQVKCVGTMIPHVIVRYEYTYTPSYGHTSTGYVDYDIYVSEAGSTQNPSTAPTPKPSYPTSGKVDRYTDWYLTSDGTITFTNSGFEILNMDVSEIPWDRGKVKKAVLNNVIVIGNNVFNGCKNLTEVHLPSALFIIGENAFKGCDKLETVYFGGSEKSWNNMSIEDGNSALTNAKIKFNREYKLGDELYWSFENKTGELRLFGDGYIPSYPNANPPWNSKVIKRVVFDGKVSKIGSNAFVNQKSLTSVEIPEGCDYIGDRAFKNCTALKSISLPESLKTIDTRALENTKVQYLYIPEGVESLGNAALADTPNLSVVVAPGISKLPPYALSNSGANALVVGEQTASDANALNESDLKLLFYIGTAERYEEICAANWNPYLTGARVYCDPRFTADQFAFGGQLITTLPENISAVKDQAFMNGDLRFVIIPDGVKTIGKQAFANNQHLKYADIPASVTSIAADAFSGCPTDLTIFYGGGNANVTNALKKMGFTVL